MVRKILIGAGVLLAVLVIAAIALVTLVDVNRFKPQIEQYVQDRYQRSLRIDGDLSLSLLPRIALSLPRASLSEPGGTGEAASLSSAKVSVAVLPLLRGEIVADRVTIAGLKARVERRADGSLSIDDLFGPQSAQSGAAPATPATSPPAGPVAPASPAADLPRFDIGGVALSDATVVFADREAGSTITIDGLDLSTGRLANRATTPLTVKLRFATTRPEASGELSLKGDAEIDLDRRLFGAKDLDATLQAASGTSRVDTARLRLGSLTFVPATFNLELTGLDLQADGKLGDDAFRASLASPRLALTENSAAGERVQATVKVSGSQAVDASIEATGLGGTSRALTVAKLSADATMRQGERTVQARLASPLKADVPAGSFVLPALAGSVVVNDPALKEKPTSVQLAGNASADTGKESLEANLTAKAPDMTVVAKLSLNGFAKPKVGFDVNADKLDVDRYFPAASASAAGGTGGAPGGGPATAPGGAAAPIDLSALADLSLGGTLSIGQLQARGLQASDVKMTVKAAGGRLAAAPVTAALYGGRLAATAAVAAGATPAANRANATVDLNGVSIGPLLKEVADKDLLEGRGDLKLVLDAAGGTADAMKRSLDGSARLHLRDGALKGINLAEVVRSARGLLQGGRNESRASDSSKKTDFTELAVSFVIKDGIASSNDLDAKSPLIRLGGEGRADLVASRLDYTVRASVVGTTTGQGGKELDNLRGITVPVKLTGPFDKLDWQIDWETAAKASLKARAESELKERFKTDDLEGKARERLGEALKDLFKR